MPKPLEPNVAEFAQRLAKLTHDIAQKATECGRDAKSIKILAVSKGQSFSAIKLAYDCGVRDFGENYAQELQVKMQLAQEQGLKDILWHFIGGIQSNKIKIICQANFIHSVASLRHANLIALQSSVTKKVFCQINLGSDRTGFKPDEIISVLPAIKKIENIQVMGLMTILPLTPSHPAEFWFDQMQDIKKHILKAGLLEEVALSMGMSADYLAAISHGANIVRIGTALFGSRYETSDISAV